MYSTRRKSLAAMQRNEERRRQEDEAPRLHAQVPQLSTLHIDVVEETGTSATRHRRHVVVMRAPALFVIACGDPACNDGGHDITRDVMSYLRRMANSAQGEHACEGNVGSAGCARHIRYELAAAYASA